MSLDREKLKAAIVFISSNPSVESLGLTKMYKLVYFSDVAHLREYGRTITGSEYIKYQHGPVPSRGEKCIKQLKRDGLLESEKVPYAGYEMIALRATSEPDESVFEERELKTLVSVCKRLGGRTAAELSDLSHEEPAWITAPMLEKLSAELMMYGAAEDPDGL